MQSYNTNAASWALASYLYKSGGRYEMVPIGLAIGAGIVIAHRILVIVSCALFFGWGGGGKNTAGLFFYSSSICLNMLTFTAFYQSSSSPRSKASLSSRLTCPN